MSPGSRSQRSGILYIRRYDPEEGNWRALSLGHRDQRATERAKEKELAGELLAQRREKTQGRVTIQRLFRKYLKHETPGKV
jgi:hypothetical protein